MAIKCDSLVEEYLSALKSDFSVMESDNGCYIVTPLSRPDGEAVEVGIQELEDGRIHLTDDGMTADYLFVNGLNLEKNERSYKEAERIARLRGVHFDKSELYVEATIDQEGDALNRLLSTIEAVTYLIYRRTHREVKSFGDEVELYLADNNVNFVSQYDIQGKTITHTAPIYINSSKNLVITPLSANSVSVAKHRVKELGFMVLDVKVIQPMVRFASIFDDRRPRWEQVWTNEDVSKILNGTMDVALRWEARQQLLSLSLR